MVHIAGGWYFMPDESFESSTGPDDPDLEDDGTLDASDTLEGAPGDDPLDQGIIPPDRWSAGEGYGTTLSEERAGESLDQLLAEEEPDVDLYAEENGPARSTPPNPGPGGWSPRTRALTPTWSPISSPGTRASTAVPLPLRRRPSMFAMRTPTRTSASSGAAAAGIRGHHACLAGPRCDRSSDMQRTARSAQALVAM